MPLNPLAPVIVALANFGTALLEYGKVDRETMDPEVRKRMDLVRVRHAENFLEFCESFKKLGEL